MVQEGINLTNCSLIFTHSHIHTDTHTQTHRETESIKIKILKEIKK